MEVSSSSSDVDSSYCSLLSSVAIILVSLEYADMCRVSLPSSWYDMMSGYEYKYKVVIIVVTTTIAVRLRFAHPAKATVTTRSDSSEASDRAVDAN